MVWIPDYGEDEVREKSRVENGELVCGLSFILAIVGYGRMKND
jgi:hypothetical protein